MIDINEYILLPKETRQTHLKLDELCVDRGGPRIGISAYCKGLLAYILDTTIPVGMKIHVCHACNNSLCSNPNHLYWGTAKENVQDRMANGCKTAWQFTVEKYGIEDAKNINKRTNNKNGSGNKGKPKSEEHRRKIAANQKGGRKKKTLESV